MQKKAKKPQNKERRHAHTLSNPRNETPFRFSRVSLTAGDCNDTSWGQAERGTISSSKVANAPA
jgi:hypothetical protein